MANHDLAWGEEKGSARGSVHWGGYDATALDIEVDPQRCRFGSRKSDFALQNLVECRERRYKPHELLQVVNMTDVMNTDRAKREEKSTNKYKSINKLIRNEDMTRTEARKTMKQVEDVLGPARNTRSQSRKSRNKRT
jgi:hypothetical protein